MVGVKKRREIVFFGSLAVSVAGQEIYDEDAVAQLERHNAFVKLHTTVTAPFRKTTEAFGAVATSPLYELHHSDGATGVSGTLGGASSQHQQQHQHHRRSHGHRQRAAFLPVLLELASGVSAADVPPVEEMDKAFTSPDADGLEALNRDGGAASSIGYTSASVRIEVDLTRSGGRTGPVGVQEIALPSLSHLARHDVCTVVRIPLLTSAIQKTAVGEVDAAAVARESAQLQSSNAFDSADSSSAAGGGSGVAMHLYVVVRVISLAEKVRLALEADEALYGLLARPDAATATHAAACVSLTQRGEAPYGAMPLTDLYRHYKRFFETCDHSVIKHGDAVMQRLVTAPRQREAEASFPHRWNALTGIDLRPLLLGERAIAPLLLTLAHCTNLRSLHADGNQLGDITCGRLAALFNRHRYLAYLGLAKNGIHEAGAAELLRLLRHNPRVTAMNCEGNYFSAAMQHRLAEAVARNAAVITNDPLNVFSPHYGYLTELSSLPEVTQRQALRTWAMLSAAPVGDVDVMVRNATTSSQRTIGDAPQVAMQRAKTALRARETFSLIPPAALAPLLNEVMRTVYMAVARMLPDPLVRSLFSDMETVVARHQEQRDAQSGNGNGGSAAGAAAALESTSSPMPQEVVRALGGPVAPPINPEKLFARSFVRMVVTMFRKLMLATPWEDIAVELEGIGRMHRDLGVMAEDYWLAVHVFMASVRISCGAECYDADHASSFLAILALAVRTTAGFDVQLE